MGILDIPFLFRDAEHVDKVLDGPFGKALLADLEKHKLKGLAFWENGFRHLTNSKAPARTPDEVKGLKVRTMENRVHMAAFKAAGINPTPMAFAEVYSALQQKVIDGQENPVAVIYSSKLYEVQKYLTLMSLRLFAGARHHQPREVAARAGGRPGDHPGDGTRGRQIPAQAQPRRRGRQSQRDGARRASWS